MCFFDLDELEEAERRANQKTAAPAETLPATLASVMASGEKAEEPASKSEASEVKSACTEQLPAASAPAMAIGEKALPSIEETTDPMSQPYQVLSSSEQSPVPAPDLAGGDGAWPSSEESPPKSELIEAESISTDPLPVVPARSEASGVQDPSSHEEATASNAEPDEVESFPAEPLPALLAASGGSKQPLCSKVSALESTSEGCAASLGTSAGDAGSGSKTSLRLGQAPPSSSTGKLSSKAGASACFQVASCGLWKLMFKAPVRQTQ
mmetsp:Transcript_133478/g.345526  ORF Transcript_133478/g.345526 Transcript_133478/m.345526 type:complete len:267 (+) Transcript_133478:72-872(+)